MLTFPAHENVPLFFFLCHFHPPPHRQFPLIVESLCLPCTHALSGNDVNRVKHFQGPRGRKALRDFGVWLAEKCNEENTLMRLVLLRRLFPSFAQTVRRRHELADAIVYSLSSAPFLLAFSPLGAAVVGSLVFFALPPFFPLHDVILSSSETSECGSSQDLRCC